MTLFEHYDEIACMWRWAARGFANRAVGASTIGYEERGNWNDLAVRATHRAARYARSAESTKREAPSQVRLLTMFELLHAKDNHGTHETEDESIQRKFCEVNGLRLATPEAEPVEGSSTPVQQSNEGNPAVPSSSSESSEAA